ncbi:MAG: hypothetical protein OEQ74_06290 [Gammaproteobacteria bacterium]|nr:hypothetical protein [Gammaproteobacteria bacterium]
MQRIFALVIVAFAVSVTDLAAETLINIEEAAEMTSFKLQLDGKTSGRVYARVCDDCALLTLRADNATSIERGRVRISLEQAAAFDEKGATVLFDPSSLRITRIIFWN